MTQDEQPTLLPHPVRRVGELPDLCKWLIECHLQTRLDPADPQVAQGVEDRLLAHRSPVQQLRGAPAVPGQLVDDGRGDGHS